MFRVLVNFPDVFEKCPILGIDGVCRDADTRKRSYGLKARDRESSKVRPTFLEEIYL